MRSDELASVAERLFTCFLGPLVLGGTMQPGRPIGGRAALALGAPRSVVETKGSGETTIARVRVARRIVPVDRFEPLPTPAEWALAAILHDLVQATHPGFDRVFRRSGPARLLEVIELTLERIPNAATLGEALSRHSWFSRVFQITRRDVDVSWWTGSQTFLGTEPPPRLLSWPDLRRVKKTETDRPLMALPEAGSAIDEPRFTRAVRTLLMKTPLTDLATLDRQSPPFAWTHETLCLCASQRGRTLMLRALSRRNQTEVATALGRATRDLVRARAIRALMIAIDVLREWALELAAARLSTAGEPEPIGDARESNGAFALGTGALAATEWIAQFGGALREPDRKGLLAILAPLASSGATREIRALVVANR